MPAIGNDVSDDGMSCSTYGTNLSAFKFSSKMFLGAYRVLVGRHKRKNHFEDLGVYGMIILKINLQEV
jgi:hypothetical protein